MFPLTKIFHDCSVHTTSGERERQACLRGESGEINNCEVRFPSRVLNINHSTWEYTPRIYIELDWTREFEGGPRLEVGGRERHGLINYIDTRAKCRHLKKLTCKGTLRQGFIRVYRLGIQSVLLVFRPSFVNCCTSNLLSGSTLPPSLHTVKVSTVYLFKQGRGGGGRESSTREKGRRAPVHKAGSKLPTWLIVSPVYKLW